MRTSHRFLLLLLFTWLAMLGIGCSCGDDDDDSGTLDDSAGGDDTSDDDADDSEDDAADDDTFDDDTQIDDTATDDTLADDTMVDDTSVDDTTDDDSIDDDDTMVHDFDGWVAGWSESGDSAVAVVYHDSHGTWSKEVLPEFDESSRLNDVSFTSPDNGWAVGALGDTPTQQALLLHRDGSGWSQVDIPEITCSELSQVEFWDQDNGFATCRFSSVSNSGVIRYQSGEWNPIALPGLGGAESDLFSFVGLTLASADHAFISGALNSAGGSSILVEFDTDHLDLVIWGPGHDFNWFEGIRVKDGTDGYLAENFSMGYCAGSFYRYDGSAWVAAPNLYVTDCISAFDRSPGGTWLAATYDMDSANVYQKLGPVWVPMTIPASHFTGTVISFHDVLFPDNSYAVAIGEDWKGDGATGEGYAIRYDGTSWRRINSLRGTMETYRGVSYVPSP